MLVRPLRYRWDDLVKGWEEAFRKANSGMDPGPREQGAILAWYEAKSRLEAATPKLWWFDGDCVFMLVVAFACYWQPNAKLECSIQSLLYPILSNHIGNFVRSCRARWPAHSQSDIHHSVGRANLPPREPLARPRANSSPEQLLSFSQAMDKHVTSLCNGYDQPAPRQNAAVGDAVTSKLLGRECCDASPAESRRCSHETAVTAWVCPRSTAMHMASGSNDACPDPGASSNKA